MKDIYNYFKKNPPCELLLVADDRQARQAYDVLAYLGFKPFVLSDFRANYLDDLLSFGEELNQTLDALSKYYECKSTKKILISPLRTITFALPKEKCFSSFNLSFGAKVDITQLKDKLYAWGYYFVDIVSSEAEVSFRGDIIDICPLGCEHGYRLSLFDDELESIRRFDIDKQISFKEELDNIEISPAFLALDSLEFDKIDKKIQAFDSDTFVKDIHSLGFWFLDDLGTFLSKELNTFFTKDAFDELDEVYINETKKIPKEDLLKLKVLPSSDEYHEVFTKNIHEFIEFHKDKKIIILSSSEARLKLNNFDLSQKNISFKIVPFIINLLGDDELILSLNKQVPKRKKKRLKFVLDELSENDFVVHETHGIGQFQGIKPIGVMGGLRDFVSIKYANNDKLLLPVENIDLIDRYIANSGSIASLDSLGKGSFAKLKAKLKDKLFVIANEIIALSAKRQLSKGLRVNIPSKTISDFQDAADFTYTKDQDKSIKELLYDLDSGLVMDRLLSGDVGFGKTEVAMNGIFACLVNGFQTLFIAPTTLLVAQHFVSISKRFKKYGFKIEKLDGKTTAKEKLRIKQALQNGELDLLVGTHALLEIKSKNLALVILDEEHKFGVKQKEKLKSLREDVHIFSMSATPIPRTLNLALSKIKGMSSLFEAPQERLGVKSFVKEFDEKLIKEVVFRQRRQAGQIFYIYNNISTIEAKKEELQALIPKIKIEIIHSKISAVKSQKILEDFGKGAFDILLATSIVESGLHFPNANLIIIDGANNFGIADLHQLRGRVGRGAKESFCYFLVENKNKLSSSAVKRLLALEKNSYLGSGHALAHQDLEIRGGGNIIGEAQSGHIKQIGYGLYLKMLEQALASLSQSPSQENKSVDIKLAIVAYISKEYIKEDRIRLELYRRLSKASDVSMVYEIEEELVDRFGKLDIPTKQFLELIIIKVLSLKNDIKSLSSYEMNINILRNNGDKSTLKSPSKDDDDIIKTTLKFLRNLP